VADTKSSPKRLSAEQLSQLLGTLKGADTVELKLSVPEENRRSAVAALGIDPLEAQIRQVAFFDTPDLALDKSGVVVRARRVQAKPGDSVVKLRPIEPDTLTPSLRRDPSFGVEVDAMPGGFVCSASMKGKLVDSDVIDAFAGRTSIRKLLTKSQRALLTTYAPDDVDLDHLAVLGPITVFKLKLAPKELGRRLVAELWNYPDGSRLLELSTGCTPAEAFQVAAELRVFLTDLGIDVDGEQQTKTRTALELFSRELAAAPAG
jgi:hypothetical protein